MFVVSELVGEVVYGQGDTYSYERLGEVYGPFDTEEEAEKIRKKLAKKFSITSDFEVKEIIPFTGV